MTSPYKILINDREYKDWELVDSLSMIPVDKIPLDPATDKLFSTDIFDMKDDRINLLHSSVRTMPSIPGILVLKDGKTFGKYKDKYLYKCIPDDRRLPVFLIPYYLKLGFSKNIDNKYVIFRFDNWNKKHPQATMVNNLGDVDILENFYEYQLYCKSLYASIQQFNKATTQALKLKTEEELISKMITTNKLIDRTKEEIFTIDSKQTTDYDDAISICKIGDTGYKVSIYISNVPMWMEELQLWDSFSERISTIYLPDRKRPMLPTILSECICSLCQDVVRLAFVLDITISNNEIIGYKFENVFVKIYKNHEYESKELKKDTNYQQMFQVVDQLSTQYKYTSKIKTSNDVIAYLMILMNYYSALEMTKYKNGIYRSVKLNQKIQKPENLDDDIDNFLTIWNSSCGHYDLYDERKCHEMLNLDSYIHCTSPIRRLVDLLNMAKLQMNLQMVEYGSRYETFHNKWTEKLEYINTTMRVIRKIQGDCNLLELCFNNPDICEKEYEGYVFDKIERNDGLFQYIVYLVELKTVSRINLRFELEDYSKNKFKIFIFNDEASLKKKIRLHLLE
jgi:exoribonuclease R